LVDDSSKPKFMDQQFIESFDVSLPQEKQEEELKLALVQIADTKGTGVI